MTGKYGAVSVHLLVIYVQARQRESVALQCFPAKASGKGTLAFIARVLFGKLLTLQSGGDPLTHSTFCGRARRLCIESHYLEGNIY